MTQTIISNNGRHKIIFVSHGRKAQCPPDPNFPHGKVMKAQTFGPSCEVDLPYPAPECGYYVVECQECKISAAVTVAGRPDDPIQLIMPCNKGINCQHRAQALTDSHLSKVE